MKKEITMKAIHFLSLLSFSFLLTACAAVKGGGDVNTGRQALFEGNYPAALSYFQAAEKADPTFIHGAELREGVLSYVGRAQYLTKDYAGARQTLEKALPSTGATMSHGYTLALRCIV